MAPIPLEPQIDYVAVGLAGGHLLLATFLSFEVGRSLYRSYRALGPTQDTRQRTNRRATLLPVFAALAAASLLSAIYATERYATLSYKVWASQRDIKLPTRFYGHDGIFPLGENATQVHVTRWLSDTPLHLDAVEIAAEKARRYWWGQQIDLGLISWSMLLAVEGRRRNIPLLWSYLALGQLVSLSFAQNLFFVALILTPTPLPLLDYGSLPVSRYVRWKNTLFPPKPVNWKPHAFLYVFIFGLNFAVLGMTPFLANTPSLKYLVLAARGLTYAPLALPNVIPESWGVQHSHPHQAYATYTKLFKFISVAAFLLHAKATAVGLAYNVPAAHEHRHSIHLPFDVETRSSWERTSGAFGRLLGATADHPVVGGIGRDVLLSALSIGLWAAVRAIDVSGILATTVPFYELHRDDVDELATEELASPTKKKRAKPKAVSTGINGTHEVDEAGSVRKRGRPRKSKDGNAGAAEDERYEPTPSEAAEAAEGDALRGGEYAVDYEATALAWGLTTLGGLGVGSAGVLGGECIAR